MSSKIKNIIIFVVIGLALVLIYIFFLKPAPAQPNLVTSSGGTTSPSVTATADQTTQIGADFLATLLSVKSISLDDSIFTDSAFASLHDSSIVLTPDQTEGRPNPFLPIGTDVLPTTDNTQANVLTQTTDTTNTSAPSISGTVGATPAKGTSNTNTTPVGTGTKGTTKGITGATGGTTNAITTGSTQ